MKKFFSLTALIGLMLTAFTFTASGKTITVVVDDPAHVTVMQLTDRGEAFPLEFEADNTAELSLTTSVPVMANTGYEITSITNSEGSSATSVTLPAGTADIDASLVKAGDTVRITTAEKAERVFSIQATHPEHIESVQYFYQNVQPSAEGIWDVVLLDQYSSITININPDYKIVTFTDALGNELPYTGSYLTISPASYVGDMTFYIDTTSKAADRTASLNVNLTGDPQNITLTRSDYSVIPLVEGEQTVYYDPENEVPFTLTHAIPGRSLFKVELDGQKVAKGSGGYYSINPVDGGNLVIDVEYPDIDIPVNISYGASDLENLISEVRVNGVIVDKSEWTSPDFTVKAGATLSFDFNYIRFTNISVEANGEVVQGSLFIDAVDNYNIVVKADRIPDLDVTIYCANYEYLTVIIGDETMELNSEEVKISVPGNMNYIQFKGRDGYLVSGVYDYRTNVPYEVTNGYLYNITNNMQLVVEVDFYELNELAVVYLEDIDWEFAMLSVGQQDTLQEINLTPGYNFVNFNKNDLPFRLSSYSLVNGNYVQTEVYLNGVHCENNYGAYSGLDAIKTNDVISIYNHIVSTYTASVAIAENAKADVEVVTNYVQPQVIEGNTLTLDVLPGTLVQIKGESLIVTKGGEPVATDEKGVYNIYVNASCDISVEKDTNTGVEAVEAATAADVYSLQGVLLKKGATPAEIEALPAGLYIVGGKKVVVK